MRQSILLTTVIVGSVFGSTCQACSTHGLTTAATLDWQPTGAIAGNIEGILTLGSSLVAPTSTTTCAAGAGLGTSANPLPAGLDVTGLEIVVVHPDGSHTPLSAFSFAPNSVTTAALAAGAGSSGPPGTNPLFAGSTWFGFSSLVGPFTLPTLGPGEYTAMAFTVEVAEALVPLVLDAQFAGGEALSNGTPIFNGDHPAQYFTAADPSVAIVPEPRMLILLALAASCVSICRRQFSSPRTPLRRAKPDAQD
jgi:hypothetical protein